jgi:nucleotide-binding universal stress UspA family protein
VDKFDPYPSAVQDFRRARLQAAVQDVLARLGGKSERLLSFEEVRENLAEQNPLPRGLKEIPLDAIVGSVGRYADFNRKFLPKKESQKERWARLRIANARQPLPPIELFQLGNVYFVLDGNHRVSIARQAGQDVIDAYVTEIPIDVALNPEDNADQIILKVQAARFFEDTQLAPVQDGVEIRPTLPGRYRELREQIAVHQYFLENEAGRQLSVEVAAKDWFDLVYTPALKVIRRKGLLRDFPDRSEADLYLWLMRYRGELSQELGWDLEADETAGELGERYRPGILQTLRRTFSALKAKIIPEELAAGPAAGDWRKQKEVHTLEDKLFGRILVAVSGEPRSWRALDQALLIANREGASLRGVHLISEKLSEDDKSLESIREKFEKRLVSAGIEGRLVIEQGNARKSIEKRSRWNDLAVLHLLHPPGEGAAERIRSGMRALIQHIPRPLLLVPRVSPMEHALLAFDGSGKAIEALFIAAYLAEHWKIKLSVVSVDETLVKAEERQHKAYEYLQKRGLEATYELRTGAVGDSLLEYAAEAACDIILIGGYGATPLVEMVIGSTLDQVLREFKGPVLVCR